MVALWARTPWDWPEEDKTSQSTHCFLLSLRFMHQYSVGDVQVASTDRAGGPASGCGLASDRPALSDMPVSHTPVGCSADPSCALGSPTK